MSKYDNIQTAAALVSEVAMHGLSTLQDDINRAADILGRSTIGELVTLANDIGRNNEKGEPDPDGSWSSGRRGTQDTFYFIAFHVWNWREATAFFNEHTNPATKAAQETTTQLIETNRQKEAAFTEIERLAKETESRLAKYLEEFNKRNEAEEALAEAEQEILTLKAQLYDHMMRGA